MSARESLGVGRVEHCGETVPHDRHEYLINVRTYDCPGTAGCTGSRYCEAAGDHVHGCFADKGDCDQPEEHRG